MTNRFKKGLLALIFFMMAEAGLIGALKAQITVDSLKRRFLNIPKDANAAKLVESIIQIQGVFYSDTLMRFNEQLVTDTKRRVGEKHPLYAMSITSIAILYMFRGDYEKALPLLQRSIAIMKEISAEDNPQYGIMVNNLALLYERMGQYDKALLLSQQALEIRKKTLPEDNPQYALLYPLSLSNLASLYMRKEEYEKALPLFQQALNIRERLLGKEHPYYAISLNNLAQVYSYMGVYDKALPLFEQALEVYEKKFGKNDLEYIMGLDNLALLYKDMGNYEKSLPLIQQVLEWRRKNMGEAHPYYANSLNNLGLLDMLSNHPADASALFIKANNITLNHLARTYSSLSEQEKIVFLNQESSQFHYLPSLAFYQGLKEQQEIVNHVYSTELALKGMVLEDQRQMLRSVRQSGDTRTLSLYEQWRFNKALLGRQALLPKAQRVSYLDSIEEATDKWEQELSRRSADFRNMQHSQTLSARDIFNKLEKGQAVVEFLRFRLYNKKWTDSIMYAAIVILPQDSNARFVPLCEERELMRILRPSINANASIYRLYPPKKLSNKKASSSDSLYQLIWKPLEKHLTGVNTIYYAPAGLMHRIAFQAMRPDSTHLLIDIYQLNQLLSTRQVASQLPATKQLTAAAIWGNIDYNLEKVEGTKINHGLDSSVKKTDTTDSSFNLYSWDTRGLRSKEWNTLPGAKKEIDSIGNLFRQAGIPHVTKSGVLATEEAFKELDGKSPQLLHLATHGFFLPVVSTRHLKTYDLNSDKNVFTVQQDPMFRSGLVLAGANITWTGKSGLPGKEDGILTAYEIAQIDLSNTDLLVLSACETALGDLQSNEGVIGLQRAFKIAGVKQMMLSLWRVPDKETMELMTLFYKNWLSGQTTREALRSAQLKMKNKYAPFYWAAFVLIE